MLKLAPIDSSIQGRRDFQDGGRTVIGVRGASLPGLSLFSLAECIIWIIPLSVLQHRHGLLKVFLPKFTTVVDNEENPVPARGEKIVLQRRGSEISVDDMTWLGMCFCDPLCKLEGIWDGGGKEDVVDFIG